MWISSGAFKHEKVTRNLFERDLEIELEPKRFQSKP